MKFIHSILIALITSLSLYATPDTDTAKGPTQVTESVINDDGVRVTILGYHDFSKTKKATEMLIPTDKFRKQMQAIHDLGLNVITMEEFLAWKRGEKKVADKSVVITIDDGWKSVYTDAYPVLREFGYPFTVFLYTNYVDGGGSALTTEMIKEMQQYGCTVGSHSVSHPFPAAVKKERIKGSKKFSAYLKQEFDESRKILRKKFKGDVTTYAYPGGFVTGEMLPVATESGYECLFTVLPGKATRTTSNFTVPRYIILGTHDYIFRNATSFKATTTSAATDGAIVQSTAHPVQPEPGILISNRTPIISADLSQVENIDPSTLLMRVAGFGKVPAIYNSETKSVSWQVNRRLRSRTCEVTISWQIKDTAKYEAPLSWTFLIDRAAAYQPK